MSTQTTNTKNSSEKQTIRQTRTNQILSTAKTILIRDGSKRLTMRRVADESEIAVGHLQHFFPTKGILLKELFGFLSNEHLSHYKVVIDKLPISSPSLSMTAIIEFLLRDVSLDDSKALFIEFWALSIRNADVKKKMDAVHTHHINFFTKLIRQINPKMSKELCEFRSIQMASLLDGLLIHSAQVDANSKKFGRFIKNTRKTLLRLVNEP